MDYKRISLITLVVAVPLVIYGANNEYSVVEDTIKVHPLNEVVVTGSNVPTGRDLLPYTVSSISSKQLEATGRTQLLSAISATIPSLFVSERNVLGFGVSSGGSGGIKIRGIGGTPTNAILMMVDGQPQYAGLFSHPISDFYSTEYVSHVEILRGPASVLYGSNAMGGVINVITKDVNNSGVSTSLCSQYGSYNTWQTSLMNTVRKNRFLSRVLLSYNRTDGTQKKFDYKQYSGYIKLGYDFNDKWKLRADYSLMKFVGNDPICAKLGNPQSNDIYHQNITRGESSISLSNNGFCMSGNTRIYYSYGNHYIDDPNHFHSTDDRLGVIAYQNFKPWNEGKTTIGVDVDTYSGEIPISGGHHFDDGSKVSNMQTITRKRVVEYSPYLTLSQGLFQNKILLDGGFRLACSDKFGTHAIPQGGFALKLGKEWTFKGSLSKGFRNPSFREMYLYLSANDELKPETMMNYELTVAKLFSQYLSVDVTVYYSKGDNLIQTVYDASIGHAKNVNTGHFINKGIEIAMSSNVSSKLALCGGYSYLWSSIYNLTASPKNQYYFSALWNFHAKWSIDAQLKGVGGLYVSDGMEHQNYILLNLKLSYSPIKHLDIFGILNNVTDAQYTINYGYKMPGINGSIGVKCRF